MAKLSRILPRLNLVEEKYAARTRAALRQSNVIQEQLHRLREYRRDYHAANAGVPALMVDAQCFVERLEVSVKELEQRHERQSRVVVAEEKRWIAARARRLAIEKLIRKQDKEQHAINRRKEINLAESLQGSHKFLNAEKD